MRAAAYSGATRQWFMVLADADGSFRSQKIPLYPKKLYHTGFNGGFRTVVFMIPALDCTASVFFLNRSDIDLEDLVSRINHMLHLPDNSFIKSASLESFIHSWPIFAPCKRRPATVFDLIQKELNRQRHGIELIAL